MTKIDDIMAATGFSRTTVSKALNDKSDISEKTKKIIRKAADDLNYVPNINARNLRSKRSKVIALILSSPSEESEKTNTLYPLLMGVNQYLSTHGFELALYLIDSKIQTMKSYVAFCRERNVAGAILVGIKTDDDYIRQLANTEIPYVLIDVDIRNTTHKSVVKLDDVRGAYDATLHLLKNNHRKIAFMNGNKNSTVSEERLKGYLKAMRNHDMAVSDEYVVYADFSEEEARKETRQLLKSHPEITALFCASDLMALGAMQGAADVGRIIPDELSLVGYDDIPIARYVTPALTTISQNFHEKGFEAAKLITTQLKQHGDQRIVIVDHYLKVRDSVRCLM